LLARGRSEEPTRFAGWGSLSSGNYLIVPMREPRPGWLISQRFAAVLTTATAKQTGWRASDIEERNVARIDVTSEARVRS